VTVDDLTELRDFGRELDAQITGPPAALRDRVLAGFSPQPGSAERPDRTRRRRAWRLALAAAVGLAAAAGIVAAQVIQSGGAGPGAGITVQELAYRTSAAAAAQPSAGPGQWVYWQEKQVGGKPADITFQVWTTADARKAAYVDNGKVRFLRLPCGQPGASPAGSCQAIGQPAVSAAARPYRGVTISVLSGHVPVSYQGLGSLPTSPRALDRYLAGLHLPGWGPAPVREFEIIKELLATYVMPPALTAELYQALGDIPGVTVDQHAVDVAGRDGIGFQITLPRRAGGAVDQIVINPHTYQLMGQQLITRQPGGSGRQVLSGTAILRMALVSGPGVQPKPAAASPAV
jgi:hypothetical protein